MKGFTKFIIENHPDPDGLIDVDSDGNHGRLHTQMCRLAEDYATKRVIEELEEQLELAEHYNASVKLSERVYEIKTRLR